MAKRYDKLIRKIMLLTIIGCFLFPNYAFAADSKEGESGQSPAGFTVESVIPENQVDTTKTYFYLNVEPNKPQTIQVKVRSIQKDPVTVKIAVHDAVSSSVGAIDYAQSEPKLDKSLKNPITSFVKVKDDIKEITVANKEEKIVEFEITPPNDPFTGVKLGSVRFVKKEDESDKKKKGLVSEYAYVIALMLTEDDEEEFNHGADLHLKKVRLDLSNGRKVIAARIQNDQPKVLQEMVIKGHITRKGETKVLDKHEQKNFSVAPNSNFDFNIPLGMENFKAGTYVFHGVAKGDGQTWRWDQEFTIGNKAADKINDESVYKVRVPNWVLWAAIALIVALIALIGYLIYRQRRWQQIERK